MDRSIHRSIDQLIDGPMLRTPANKQKKQVPDLDPIAPAHATNVVFGTLVLYVVQMRMAKKKQWTSESNTHGLGLVPRFTADCTKSQRIVHILKILQAR